MSEAVVNETIEKFLTHLAVERGASKNTLSAYEKDIEQFKEYCQAKKLSPLHCTYPHLRRYLAHLNKLQLSKRSIARKASTLKQFYKLLLETETIEADPAENLYVQRQSRKLPGAITEEEIGRLIEAPDTSTESGVRDRAILEVWYGSGCAVSEIVRIRLKSLDMKQERILFEKSRTKRWLPINKEAIRWVTKYLTLRKAHGRNRPDSPFLFVDQLGKPLSRYSLWRLLKRYANLCDLGNRISPQTLRHTFAIHLMNGGVRVEQMRRLLGHKSIATTDIYQEASTESLKNVQLRYHPRS